jgi:hypothetical protein
MGISQKPRGSKSTDTPDWPIWVGVCYFIIAFFAATLIAFGAMMAGDSEMLPHIWAWSTGTCVSAFALLCFRG